MANGAYLEKDRLGHVLAAIQIMGMSNSAWGTLNRWISELEGGEDLTPKQLGHAPVHFGDRKKWAAVFEQHPEFFKTFTVAGEERVALRMRFAQSVNNADKNGQPAPAAPADTTPATAWRSDSKPAEDGNKPDNRTLTPEQIALLMTTAIELHGRAVAARDLFDRYGPPFLTAIGAVVGALFGGGLVALFSWAPLARHVFD
jgi:hypothetical protein